MIERVSFTSRDGSPCDGAFAAPAGKAAAAAVVVLQEWWGINDQIRHVAQRLADDGFVALVPDLYHGRFATSAAEAESLMQALDWKRAIGDIAGAVEHMRQDPRGTGKIAVLGFCMGGALSFASACAIGGLAAVVPFYGVPGGADWNKVEAPILAHFAARDEWATPERGREIQQALASHGKSMQLEVYDADHAFMNERRPEVYNPTEAQVAWERTIAFLRKHTARPRA